MLLNHSQFDFYVQSYTKPLVFVLVALFLLNFSYTVETVRNIPTGCTKNINVDDIDQNEDMRMSRN